MELSEVKTVGSGLARPEGVMAFEDGTVITADARGCCGRIAPDGSTSFFGDVGGVPNGICIDILGNCIIANIGNGTLQSLAPDGSHKILLDNAGGRPIPSPNFPFMESAGRLWVSVSSAREVDAALQNPMPDGFIVMLSENQAVIAAEGLYFANGIAVDRKGKYLYAAETTRRAVTRFRINENGILSERETYGPEPLGELGFPDGIALDEEENLWVTFPAWPAVGFISPDRKLSLVLEDPLMKVLKRPTNICFGGRGRRTAFIGSLEGESIACFNAPYPGQALVHQEC